MTSKIGDIVVKGRAFLSPMASVNDIAFRILCKKYGASVIYTEMVSAEALISENDISERKSTFTEFEKPIAVQLMGSKIKSLVSAAKIVEKKGASLIDINMGCPDPKVRAQGAGSSLLTDHTLIFEIISSLVTAVSIPITAKIRLKDNSDGVKIARVLEQAGCSAIGVHARTAKQKYSGKADWSSIKDIKEAVSIPVIGNGDIFSAFDAQEMLKLTGCDFVMIGRGAIGNPFIFREVNSYLDGKQVEAASDKEKVSLWFDYLDLLKKHGCYSFPAAKIQAMYFTKGISGSVDVRRHITGVDTIEDLEKTIKDFSDNL